ncbi:MAG: U32 family peptidase [Anaerofustis stercorihominis]|nr:U32 family peptidase [Anaerofustis stercorihominis]
MKIMAPAGDLEKLKYAVDFGADVVYLGGQQFGMRANAGNFTMDEIREGVKYAHERGAQVNVTVNIMARSREIGDIVEYAKELWDIGVDALIVADLGVFYEIKKAIPDAFISVSTQTSTTNSSTIELLHKMGAGRAVLARELSYEELKEICENKPEGMEIEVFAHGAMCISYSGRCLLSNYLTGRDSNRGECAQPCRWQYSLMESTRPGEYFPIEENERGTFIFNSKDLCLVEHIPDLMKIGVDSIKIEGRMKSIFYVATVTAVYKEAIKRAESYLSGESERYVWEDLYEELTKVSHRDYTKAFYYGKTDETSQNYGTSSYVRNYDFMAQVLEDTDENGITKISQRNKFTVGEEMEVLTPGKVYDKVILRELFDEKMQEREDAPHPKETLYAKFEGAALKKGALIRKNVKKQ